MLETTEGARQADGVIGSSIVTSHRFPRVETRRKGLRSIDGDPDKVKRLWLTSLKRRCQNATVTWEKFTRLIDRFFPPIRRLHPQPVTASTPKPKGGARCV